MSTTTAASPSKQGFGIPFLTGKQIRQGFIDFFAGKGHVFVPSAPVVPHDDPTLLFTNAGMNQFKSALLGDNREGWKRVANSQKCIRVSGKHNDLDEVGRDTYHHTFFEMLGNWSFGDYYKKEAIAWSWELLTEVWKLPKDRLFVTVFRDDDEAEALWKSETDISHDRIMRFGEKSNFWEMGDVGPCGPCSEIHFDMGDPATQAATFSDPVEGVNGTNARYIELWNNVFMQSERLAGGALKPLKSQNVDTGMGFERIVSVIQGTGSNYETDVFQPIIARIAELSGVPYSQGSEGTPHRVMADHVRALSFAIADGATPGNEGRGYVLRRILRRGSRFARNLGQRDPFLWKLVETLAGTMGEAYPELAQRRSYIEQVIRAEEERFMRTLDQGLDRFAKMAAEVKAKQKRPDIGGAEVFLLYDTYGFPTDLTRVLAEEQGLSIDEAGYAKFMEEQRERARGAAKFDGSLGSDEGWTLLSPALDTEFIGYATLVSDVDVRRYREVGDQVLVVLDRTPFYAEAGGQVGDTGTLTGKPGPAGAPLVQLRVLDTVKMFDMVLHKCDLLGGVLSPETMKGLKAEVDAENRFKTVRNHSATHLLHAALREVLGGHVQQQGSRVAPESLRFDFTHFQGMTPEEIRKVEYKVNRAIEENHSISHAVHGIEEAKKMGAMALFGEKYGDKVRVITMGDVSMELCGGTHANATGEIGLLKIVSESSIAAGVRRIEAVTGLGALEMAQRQFNALAEIAKVFKAKPGQETEKVAEASARIKALEKEVLELRQAQAGLQAASLIAERGKDVNGTTVIVLKLDEKTYPRDAMSHLVDGLAGRLRNGVAVLTQVSGDSLSIYAAAGKEAQARVKAGDLIKAIGPVADARGGGKPDRAQAGSKSPDKESLVLAEAEKFLKQALGG
ncbi:MAG TPA: alanine--tRNA ligase [Fibrobacteria bacterium]|nr:alanine--tRNA ligase [Fibrobacteria bacterium]